ncbi:MAG: hypothetical protein PVF27_00100 [Gemmatimonadales bacterium]|jgi:hypothetical protein
MGIYRQPNTWQCGPFALKYALLSLGIFADEDDLAAIAGTSARDGTDEVGLGRAASAFGARLALIRRRTARGAKRALDGWLRRGVPVLICVDQWDHWVTVVGNDGERYVLLDSQRSRSSVLAVVRWNALASRLVYRWPRLGGLWTTRLYDLQPVVPHQIPATRFRLTPTRAEYLMNGGAWLAGRWDEYARELRAVVPNPSGNGALPLANVLHSARASLLGLVAAQRGAPRPAAASAVIDGAVFVADLYDVRISSAEAEDVIETMAPAVVRLAAVGYPAAPSAWR